MSWSVNREAFGAGALYDVAYAHFPVGARRAAYFSLILARVEYMATGYGAGNLMPMDR
jgi:hypothetical protein